MLNNPGGRGHPPGLFSEGSRWQVCKGKRTPGAFIRKLLKGLLCFLLNYKRNPWQAWGLLG